MTAVKNGDLKAMSQISGDEISEDELSGMDLGQMAKLMKALFSKVNVNVTLKESNDKTCLLYTSRCV